MNRNIHVSTRRELLLGVVQVVEIDRAQTEILTARRDAEAQKARCQAVPPCLHAAPRGEELGSMGAHDRLTG